jgi:deoxyxylulose-5-phosphate synthase
LDSEIPALLDVDRLCYFRLVNITGLSSARGRLHVGLAAAVIVAVLVGITIGVPHGSSAKGYCLYIGTNQSGNPGALAVPQQNSTQSSCNALVESVQILFANWQTRNESFAISGDGPMTLSSGQAAGLKPFTAQPGWLIYSGSV